MASGRQVEYRLKLNSNASQVLNQDTQAANKFDNSMWQVQKTLAAFGVGLGAHFLIDAAKGWTQAAADYEQAMLRIKNASTEGFGIFNEGFLNQQVDKFKLKLQETSDAYGSFLFKIKNAHLDNNVANRLFENLNVVGKVGAIPQEQMDATVRNVGILLGEGVLEARHLRQLSYVHPQIVPFLADALGIKSGGKDEFSKLFKTDISDETAQQKLSQLISSGKLTKLALNSDVILEAFEKYRKSIENKLPETLDTIQSHLNSLSVTWERFKNSLILGQKPELLQLFQDLEKGIGWLVQHEEDIVKTGKSIFEIVKLYAEWRLALIALELPFGIIKLFTNEYSRLLSVIGLYRSTFSSLILGINLQTTSYEAQSVAINEVSTALMRLSALQGTYVRNSVTGEIVGTVTAAEAATSAGATETIAGGGLLAALSSSGAIASAIVTSGIAIVYGINKLADSIDARNKNNKDTELNNQKTLAYNALAKYGLYDLNDPNIDKYTFLARRQRDLKGTEFEATLESRLNNGNIKPNQLLDHVQELYKDLFSDKNTLDIVTLKQGYRQGSDEERRRNLVYEFFEREFAKFGEEDKNSSAKTNKGIHIPDQHKQLRGNSSNYFTVNIHGGVNGLKDVTFQNSSAATMQDVKQMVGVEITRNLLEIINDIQLAKLDIKMIPNIPNPHSLKNDEIIIPKPNISLGVVTNLFGILANKALDNFNSQSNESENADHAVENLTVASNKTFAPDAIPDGKGGYKSSPSGYWTRRLSAVTGLPVMSAITFVGTSYTALDGSIILIPTITFEMVLISMRKGKNIEMTNINGRDIGSVKEYIGAKDWDIEIRAVITASQSVSDGMTSFYQTGKYPEENMEKIDLLLNAPIAIKVICPYMNKRGINYIVINDGTQINQIEGEYEAQRLIIPCVSDAPLIIQVASV